MPDITQCPECQRKLNVPDGQLGSVVRCPACGNQFTAERYAPPRPAAVAREPDPEPEPPREPPPGPSGYPGRRPDRDYDDRRDYDDDYDRRPRRPYGGYRRGYRYGYGSGERYHRGSTIQGLGILCLCLCWTTIPCLILGIVTLVMASQDLTAMERGEMDPSGRGPTKVGQTCAIIGLILSGLLIFTCCGINILGAAGGLR